MGILCFFKDVKALSAFEEAIRTPRKHPNDAKRTTSDYDVMVIYTQQSPIHATRLWLGEKDQESVFSYGFRDWEEAMWFRPKILTA